MKGRSGFCLVIFSFGSFDGTFLVFVSFQFFLGSLTFLLVVFQLLASLLKVFSSFFEGFLSNS